MDSGTADGCVRNPYRHHPAVNPCGISRQPRCGLRRADSGARCSTAFNISFSKINTSLATTQFIPRTTIGRVEHLTLRRTVIRDCPGAPGDHREWGYFRTSINLSRDWSQAVRGCLAGARKPNRKDDAKRGDRGASLRGDRLVANAGRRASILGGAELSTSRAIYGTIQCGRSPSGRMKVAPRLRPPASRSNFRSRVDPHRACTASSGSLLILRREEPRQMRS